MFFEPPWRGSWEQVLEKNVYLWKPSETLFSCALFSGRIFCTCVLLFSQMTWIGFTSHVGPCTSCLTSLNINIFKLHRTGKERWFIPSGHESSAIARCEAQSFLWASCDKLSSNFCLKSFQRAFTLTICL
jgi:hypothetical protein